MRTLADLDASLRARGSQLYCLRGASPAEALEKCLLHRANTLQAALSLDRGDSQTL